MKSEQIHNHTECRKEIQLGNSDANNKSLTQKIGQDLWRQLKRVSIPLFNGDKINYKNWKPFFNVCVDQVPATAEYKLLQLRQYVPGEAPNEMKNLDHSSLNYEAAIDQLEREYGGQRHKLMQHKDEHNNFKLIRINHPKDVEKFSDLLDIAVINLKEENRMEELSNSTFCQKR